MKRIVMVSVGAAAALAATAVAALGPASAPGWEETSGSGGAFIVGKFADRTPDAAATMEKAEDQATSEAATRKSTDEACRNGYSGRTDADA